MNLNCKKIKKYIVEYLDGDMPQEERTKFLAHFGSCEKCQEEWGYQIRLASELNSGIKMFKEGLNVPVGLKYDILREIRNIAQPRSYWVETLSMIFRIPVLVHAAIIVILGVFIIFSTISIRDIGRIHPIKLMSKQRIYERLIFAHIRIIKEGLTKGLARDMFRAKISSRFYILAKEG